MLFGDGTDDEKEWTEAMRMAMLSNENSRILDPRLHSGRAGRETTNAALLARGIGLLKICSGRALAAFLPRQPRVPFRI